MGAKISGSHLAYRRGSVSSLHAAEHAVLPDRIETAPSPWRTAIAGGEVDHRHACRV